MPKPLRFVYVDEPEEDQQPSKEGFHPLKALEGALSGVKYNEAVLPNYLAEMIGGKQTKKIGEKVGEQIAGGSTSAGEAGHLLADAVMSGFGSDLPGFGAASAIKGAAKGYKYIHPEKTAEAFMKELGQGKTAEQNIQELSETIKSSRTKAEKEALAHKEKLMSPHGEEKINPENYLTHPKVGEHYSEALAEKHKAFEENPSIKNADELLQGINSQLNPLYRIKNSKFKKLDNEEKAEFKSLSRDKSNILTDLEEKIKTLPKKVQKEYETYRKKWSENVAKPFEEHSPLIAQLSKGSAKKATPGNVQSRFAFNESPEMTKLVESIGEPGKKNILYNYLLKSGAEDSETLAKAIIEGKKKKGMSRYITPEMEQMAHQLQKREHYRKIAYTAIPGVAGLAAGSPVLGGLASAGMATWQYGKPALEVLGKVLGRK